MDCGLLLNNVTEATVVAGIRGAFTDDFRA